MATFVLTHGTWQASWIWRDVVPMLERQGHRAIAVDLPGHGADRTPLGEIRMQHYVDAVARTIDTLDEPPILAGHSMGGMIAAVAEARSEALAAVVFVAANIPASGKSMLSVVEQVRSRVPRQLRVGGRSEDGGDHCRRRAGVSVPPVPAVDS